MAAKFDLGMTVATPGALDAMHKTREDPGAFLARHESGDWGEDLPPEDAAENRRALQDGGRLFSAYHLKDGVRIWVITEADRSATTILLPEEY